MAEADMGDTQGPQFVVFHQAAADRPHVHAGSVHAPDAELALMNARDVFVRRPACVSLWVARADRVLARTREELAHMVTQSGDKSGGQPELYAVFQKQSQAGACTFVGQVEGTSSIGALEAALDAFSGSDPLVWWLIPERAIHRSDAADRESLFSPAEGKEFRSSADFKTLTAMRKIRKGGEGDRDGP